MSNEFCFRSVGKTLRSNKTNVAKRFFFGGVFIAIESEPVVKNPLCTFYHLTTLLLSVCDTSDNYPSQQVTSKLIMTINLDAVNMQGCSTVGANVCVCVCV
eukprot:TRINITY_DN31558_c1_g1_i7.p1 TRINITY_DN31558_c1_g1~~TRINITY_DN31558_c1_g1_i7.p1  ORF type:complete len:101 (-),score=14.77 TRINITY_DN31558_c1_g1_i7:152-454(-)